MKILTRKKNKVDQRIDEMLDRMETMDPSSSEYCIMAQNVDMLMKAKSSNRLSKDAIFAGVINIAGICLVLFWEEGHIVAKKAWGLIHKGRI